MLWAANELLAVFAPAFPLSLLRQEIAVRQLIGFSDFLGLRAEVTLEKKTPEFKKVQVRAEVKLLNFVEDDFYEF